MLHAHLAGRLEEVVAAVRTAAERHGGSVLAVSQFGSLMETGRRSESSGPMSLTLCFSDLYASLLRADVRFAAFLPARVALCTERDGVSTEAISARDCCRLLQRPDIERLAGRLEDKLLVVIAEAARICGQAGSPRIATEDLINMRATVPQRIDCRGTKIEELAGTGIPDAPGG